MYTVLDRLEKRNIYFYPYPHIIIENALPDGIIKKLISETSIANQIINDSINLSKTGLSQEMINKEPSLEHIQEFSKVHSSKKFFKSVFDLFEKQIRERLFLLPKNYLEEVSGSCTFVKNPTSENNGDTILRKPHVDGLEDIFAFLLYLRSPHDNTQGGDLEIYKFKTKFNGFDRSQFEDDRYFKPEDIKLCKTVKYQSNTLVLLIDGISSIHGVTPRKGTTIPRNFLTGGAQWNRPTYDHRIYLNPYQKVIDFMGYYYQSAGVRLKRKFFKSSV